MIPVLSLMLLDKGTSLSSLAVVLGVYSMSIFITEIPSGVLADLLGRKHIFIASCALYSISSIVLLFLKGWWLILCMIPWGAGKAFATGSFDALAIDNYIAENGKEKLSAVTGELALLGTLGIASGAVLGGLLPGIAQKLFPALGMYDLNLILKCVLCSVTALLAVFYLKETPLPRPAERLTLKKHLAQSLSFVKQNRTVRLLVTGIFFGGFFLSTIETYWQPVFVKLIDSRFLWTLGFISFGCFSFAAAGNFVMKKALGRYFARAATGYNIARILMSVFLIVLALQHGAVGFGASFCIAYLLFGAGNVAENTLINRDMPPGIRAGFLSFISFTYQGSAILSPLYASPVVLFHGISALWLLTGIFMLCVSVLIAVLMHIKTKKTI